MKGANSMAIARPLVVFAARFLGPGPTRLRLVRLAHGMNGGVLAAASDGRLQEAGGASRTAKRAA